MTTAITYIFGLLFYMALGVAAVVWFFHSKRKNNRREQQELRELPAAQRFSALLSGLNTEQYDGLAKVQEVSEREVHLYAPDKSGYVLRYVEGQLTVSYFQQMLQAAVYREQISAAQLSENQQRVLAERLVGKVLAAA